MSSRPQTCRSCARCSTRRSKWRSRRIQIPAFIILRLAALRTYYEGWGRPGDRGLIAEVDGRPAGAVWYRFFADAVHGDGYVAADVPELAIAVVKRHRGRRIGRRLLAEIADVARRDGLTRIALSVEKGNRRSSSMRRAGYQVFAPDDPKGRMVLSIGEPAH